MAQCPSRASRAVNHTKLALASCLVLLGSPTLADSTHPIAWRTDLAAAKAEARARNLPLWIQFTGPWCPYCVRMEREVFIDPGISRLAREHFVPVKLTTEDDESLTQALEVVALPTTVILQPTGEQVARQEGFADVAEFQTFLSGTLARQARRPPPTRANVQLASTGRATAIAVSGFCPVTLVKSRRVVLGQEGLAIRYDGLEYRFASEAARHEFLKEPERYVPASGGRCVVTLIDRGDSVTGDPHAGALYKGRVYLFADMAARERFVKNPARYCDADLADHGFCPHCRSERGALVPGRPAFQATVGGRRYLFPDAQHLAAFRATSDRVAR